MQLTNNSQKLIAAIVALTMLGVMLAAPSTTTSGTSIADTEGQSRDFLLDPTTIKSLTNLTQIIQLHEVNDTQQYRGYIQGVGYSSYQLFAKQGQQIHIQLDASDNIEMLLYGTDVIPLAHNDEYTFPENGLYDLRVLYKPSVELAQQSKKSAQPDVYRIAFTLKSPSYLQQKKHLQE